MATRADIISAIDRANDANARKIARAMLDSIENLRELITLSELEALIRDRPAAAIRLFDTLPLENVFAPVGAEIAAAATAGAALTASSQGPVRNAAGQAINFVFNVAEPAVGEYAGQISARRVREVSEGVRQVVRGVVREEVMAGVNPRDTARRIRESVGLTVRQERAVSNFRRMLERGDPGALDRALRDKRFDGSIRRAISGERELSQAQIDRMVARYREKYVKYRSEVIGRTEAIRALSGGGDAYMRGQVEAGLIEARQIIREWIPTRDGRTREAHIAIPRMNPEGVGLDEPFQSPLGPIWFPGDPNSDPANSIQCRCAVFQRVLSPELVGLEPAA